MTTVDLRIEQFPVYVKKDSPVTINYCLITDGLPPAVGSRLVFGFYGKASFLHASTPPAGAEVTHTSFNGRTYVSMTITAAQSVGWNTQRTLTVLPVVEADPASLSELCSIEVYKPYGVHYWPVYARGDTREASIETRFTYKARWLDNATQSWVYSYDIVLKARRYAVPNWRLSFCDVPLGTNIHSDVWAAITHDGTEGVVELVTPDDDKYVLHPGQELSVSIQLRYRPGLAQTPALERLSYLTANPR